MKLRAFAVALIGVALLHPPVAHAAPPALTITGTQNSVAYLTVRTETTYDVRKAAVDFLSGRSNPDHARGRYGGFAIGNDAPALWAVHDLEFPAISGESVSGGVLKPGRYKVHLFADGDRVTVTVPWSGPNVTVEPVTPMDASVTFARTPVATAADTVAVALPQAGQKGARTAAGSKLDALVGPSLELRLCLTRSDGACERPVVDATVGVGGTALNGYLLEWLYDRRPTKGMYVRAEVTGASAGTLTLTTLRYYPTCETPAAAKACARRR